MAFGDIIQTATGTGTSGDSSATFGSAVTAGNLIVYVVARSTSHALGGDWGAPNGFTDGPDSGIQNGNMGSAGWWAIAAGGETAISVINGVNSAGNWCAAAVEIEGPFDASPFDDSADDETNLATTTTTQASGSVDTTVATAVAVAWFAIDVGSNFGTRAYTNSFTERIVSTSGARAGAVIATRTLSATGTYTSTLSYSAGGAADEMYGGILAFKGSSGGGGSAFPHYYYQRLRGA